MNKNYYAEIGCTNSGMFYGTIKEDIFKDKSFMPTISGCQDFTCAGVHHFLHGHGVPYNNITVKN